MSPARYDFELEMIKLAGARSVPMLGICGGMQAINVAMGGSLVQDIPAQYDRPLPHRQTARATALSHSVSVSPRTLLRRITRHDTMRVNSSHHQSVKEVGRGLSPSALAPDGVIEAIEAEDHRQPFLLGVQWHPEFLYDRHAVHRRVFSAFVRAARQGVRRPH
jgi:putative glutamine amidotransferase